AHLEKKGDEMRVQIASASPLKATLSEAFGPPELSALSFMKVLNSPELCAWINQAQILPDGVQLQSKESGFALWHQGSSVWSSPDEGHILQLFFGPWKPSSLSLPKALKTLLAETHSIEIY